MKVISKILLTIIIIFGIFFVLTPMTQASTISDIFTKADDFIQMGDPSTTTMTEENLQNMSNILYNTLLIIGIVAAVIIGMLIGIKMMTGSVEEKAKTKEMLIPYVAGCIVVFGAFTIWRIVVTILQSA